MLVDGPRPRGHAPQRMRTTLRLCASRWLLWAREPPRTFFSFFFLPPLLVLLQQRFLEVSPSCAYSLVCFKRGHFEEEDRCTSHCQSAKCLHNHTPRRNQ